MITTLPDRIAALSPELRRACERIFDVSVATGYAEPPLAMHAWVERQFGALEPVRQQTIVRVINRLTLEGALFNPLRARRPAATSNNADLEPWIEAELTEDTFRDPERGTTADLFGRIQGRYCVSASNIAKYEGWHGVIIFDEPHPLHWGREQLRDYLDVAGRWLQAAHAQDSQAIYPIVSWNCLPKSGATLMHGHMQVALGHGMHFARVELWRRAAVAYSATQPGAYFADLVAVHAALGLAVPQAGALHAFAHLTPLRSREIVMLGSATPEGQHGTDPLVSLSPELADALYNTLRALIDQQGMRAFNVVIALPPLAPTAEDWSGIPLILRIGDRGTPYTMRSDWGAMELFATGCVTVDPFDVAVGLLGTAA